MSRDEDLVRFVTDEPWRRMLLPTGDAVLDAVLAEYRAARAALDARMDYPMTTSVEVYLVGRR